MANKLEANISLGVTRMNLKIVKLFHCLEVLIIPMAWFTVLDQVWPIAEPAAQAAHWRLLYQTWINLNPGMDKLSHASKLWDEIT